MATMLAPDDLARLDLQRAGVADSVSAGIEALAVPANARVLELGCGTGVLTTELMRLLPGATLDAVDQDKHAIHVASERLRGQVTWHWAKATDFLRSHAGYDLIVCRLFLMHQAAPAALMRTARRSLVPGGAFIAVEFDLGAALWWPTCAELDRVLRAASVSTALARIAGVAVPDPLLGRQLGTLARRSGYDRWDVHARSRTVVAGSEDIHQEAKNLIGVLAMLRPLLLSTGHASGEDFDAVARLVNGWPDSPDFFALQTMFTLVASTDREAEC